MSERKRSYAAALVDALHDGLRADPRVSIIGGYVLGLGPQRTLADRLKQDFPDRVFDPPTSEAGSAAVGIGAAMAGMRPFVDLGTGSFSYLAWSQITNEAAVAHYMSNGRLTAPVTFHMLHGVRGGGAPQHSQSPHAMLWNAPGLEIAAPSTAADVYGLIRTALASPNPTVVVSHAKLLGIETPVPEQKSPIPFGRADIKRRGRDVTVVATSLMVHYCLAAAEALAREGIDVEVVDPRTLVPLDEKTILDSVSRTGRLVVVDECPLRGGIASEIAATVAERGFRYLRAPIARVTRPDAPVPYSLPLENFIMPDPEKIASGVRRVLAA
ncbi:MAG: alpha-ketoacid dehydrogenase subunit beta [Betaproteobacteria bacterium]|nr:alpha-ketoacid dehydrogenase subunit beta [Betaproteobacteria bacterium]